MPNRNLQELPKFEDNWSHLYFEKGRIDQFQKSIGFHYLDKVVPIPIETIGLLLLGPGTSITHEAIKRISDSRCLLAWTGEGGVRFYSAGYTGTYSARNLLRQVEAYGDLTERDSVVRRMYQFRFSDVIPVNSSIEQIRGLEGARVRKIYKEWSEKTGVPWKSRSYDQNSWDWSDPVNRALSSANACLYGVVHAAILQSGFSPAIGFVHTGKQLSFVYDIADLYKAEITIPLAFEITAEDATNVERRVRFACRDKFKQSKLLKRIIPDIKELIYGGSDFRESEDFSEGRDIAVSH
ncbi:CRISPR-associated endonuclease Cas1, subtype TIGR03638 [Leptospira weilii serovar Ranarum str. ICFT]|uniref:CRISPR-associated endonuclease Cas1 n=1 Tax=Leptospira weilii serovar Ranarum str. ICFT TaxID=1218598 RepID=N1WDP4_9LEPT|nr:type I-E CRISPR-associated endonuclease Cas1e [Leptospira weilii]EMY78376.1 CRISPR-associated endonuclease Cas1, subtype TIGR03638 [Leptospira weilii serovar Ranarum str. ICFT]